MSPSVELPDDLVERLKALGGGLFTVPEVIARLERTVSTATAVSAPVPPTVEIPQSVPVRNLGILSQRTPRERGATVEVAGQRIRAGTVSDLYKRVLRFVLDKGYSDALKSLVPYQTSNQRYLIAREAKHPNGNPFFVPVQVDGYFMEAHKNYETALKQLEELLNKLGLPFRYLGQ